MTKSYGYQIIIVKKLQLDGIFLVSVYCISTYFLPYNLNKLFIFVVVITF